MAVFWSVRGRAEIVSTGCLRRTRWFVVVDEGVLEASLCNSHSVTSQNRPLRKSLVVVSGVQSEKITSAESAKRRVTDSFNLLVVLWRVLWTFGGVVWSAKVGRSTVEKCQSLHRELCQK